MFYKEGSIIPRSLVRCTHRKTQHLWKFGCDVEVTGREIKALSKGNIIENNRSFIGGSKGKPKLYTVAELRCRVTTHYPHQY